MRRTCPEAFPKKNKFAFSFINNFKFNQVYPIRLRQTRAPALQRPPGWADASRFVEVLAETNWINLVKFKIINKTKCKLIFFGKVFGLRLLAFSEGVLGYAYV